jgi:hypothetical protein
LALPSLLKKSMMASGSVTGKGFESKRSFALTLASTQPASIAGHGKNLQTDAPANCRTL